MDPTLVHGILLFVVLLICLVVHEASHALVALWCGDPTAYHGGQVTLNPMPHIQREPFGTIILPIASIVMSQATMCFGFAHAPLDAFWATRNPRKAALVSFAGPLSNLLMAGIAFVTFKILISQGQVMVNTRAPLWELFRPADGSDTGTLHAVCQFNTTFLVLNLLLGILNLIPYPPLDGAGVLGGIFPKSLGKLYGYIQSQPIFMIVGFIAIYYQLPKVFYAVLPVVVDWLSAT